MTSNTFCFFLIIYKSKLFCIHFFMYRQCNIEFFYLSRLPHKHTSKCFLSKETSKVFLVYIIQDVLSLPCVERFNLLYTFSFFFLAQTQNNHRERQREKIVEVDDYDIILTSLINSVKVSTTPRRIVQHVATRAIKTRSIRTWRACG